MRPPTTPSGWSAWGASARAATSCSCSVRPASRSPAGEGGRAVGDPDLRRIPPAVPPGVHDVDLGRQGYRVVTGQRILQAQSDPFLGWVPGAAPEPGGEHRPVDFYWRQFRDMKGSVDLGTLRAPSSGSTGGCAAGSSPGRTARAPSRPSRRLHGSVGRLRPGHRRLVVALRRPGRTGLRPPGAGGRRRPAPAERGISPGRLVGVGASTSAPSCLTRRCAAGLRRRGFATAPPSPTRRTGAAPPRSATAGTSPATPTAATCCRSWPGDRTPAAAGPGVGDRSLPRARPPRARGVLTEVIKRGRALTTVTASMEAGGRSLVLASPFGDLSTSTGRSWSRPPPASRRPRSASR